MDKKPKNNRKVILINPAFQLKVVGYFIALAMFNVAIFYASIHYFFWNLKNTALKVGLPPKHVFYLFVDEQSTIMGLIFLAVAVFTIAFLFITGLYISHRIAGPLYRLKKHLDTCSSNKKLDEVHFRKGDFFPEVQNSFNQLVDKFDE